MLVHNTSESSTILLDTFLFTSLQLSTASTATFSVKSHQKISDLEGGFTGVLSNRDQFGSSVTSIGDLDGDGVVDLAVGAIGDNDGGRDTGAVWVLCMNTNGTVKTHQKISNTEGGFTGVLSNRDQFGSSVTSIGDLDGEG
jgi:hypothetical protein